VATVRLLISELVTNSVRHGGPDEAGDIELSVAASSEAVRIEVADSGRGFAVRPRLDGRTRARAGASTWSKCSATAGHWRDAGMRIWFEIDCREAAAAA
jgi:serine/threonine-protein kinase RsbW